MTFKFPKFGVNFDVEKHTILLGLAGSRSYGTDHPNSDTDYRGILVPPREYYMSPFKNFEQTGWKGDGVDHSNDQPCMFDSIKDSQVTGLVCNCPRCSPSCIS